MQSFNKRAGRTEADRLLRAIHSFLQEREDTKEGRMWKSLTEEQKREVLQAYEDSENENNLLEDGDVWKNLK